METLNKGKNSSLLLSCKHASVSPADTTRENTSNILEARNKKKKKIRKICNTDVQRHCHKILFEPKTDEPSAYLFPTSSNFTKD